MHVCLAMQTSQLFNFLSITCLAAWLHFKAFKHISQLYSAQVGVKITRTYRS